MEILYLELPYNLWEQQNCPKLRKNESFDHYFVSFVVLSLRLVVLQ